MVKTLTGKFKVETVWPELINKRIQQIDSSLKEIHFFNQGDSLMAKGSLKRLIRYLDSNGKFRKTEDKLQFELIIGAALPEPLPFLTPKLKSDYFIFQPRRLGENQAMLEQGFTLIINQYEVIKEESRPFSILTDLVTGRGKGETVLSLPVNLKRGSSPKKFNGVIKFDRSKPPVAAGIVTGAIIYRNSHNILKEQEVNSSFSFLINRDPKDAEGELTVNGSITAVDWVSPSNGQGWIIEIKLEYSWELIVRKEISVLGETGSAKQSGTTIKADLFVKEERLQFPKNFKVEGSDETGPFEVESSVKLLNWKRVNSGLLIGAALHFELFLPDASGIEKYRSLCFETEEWVADFFENIDELPDLTLDFDPDLSLERITYAGPDLLIEAILKLTVKMYQPRVISLIQENAATEIICLVPAVENNFVVLSETGLNLSNPLWKIIKVGNRLIQIDSSLKKGWLNLDGVSEITVTYLDRQSQYREESFRHIFQKSYYWEAVKDDQDYKIDLNAKLEYDSSEIEGNRLLYKYLWNFCAAAFIKRRVLAAVSSVNNSPASVVYQPNLENGFQEFLLQGEVPLQFGNPRAIAAGRGIITEFNWQSALNAILVEGRIDGEIEYWDEDGFLRLEKVTVTFWRYLAQPKLVGDDTLLVPRLRRLGYFPLKPWPWRKGTVRYEAEIEINNQRDEVPYEGFITKPE